MISRDNLKAAFESVDTNNSGSIDISELGALCAKVNLEGINNAEVQELFNEMDTNHDGKISLEEFIAWYRLGRKSKLRNFLKFQLKCIDKFDVHFTKKYKTTDHTAEEGRHQLVEVEIRDGEPSEQGAANFTFSIDSQPHLADMDRFQACCPNLSPGDTQAFAAFCFKSHNPAALTTALTTFIDTLKELMVEKDPSFQQLIDMTPYEIGNDGEYVCIGFTGENPFFGPYIMMAQQVQPMVDQMRPEIFMNCKSDKSLKMAMNAPNFYQCTDASRFFFGISFDKNAKNSALEYANQFGGGGGTQDAGANMMKLCNGLRLRVRTNPDSQAGENSYNGFKNSLQAMAQLEIGPVTEFCNKMTTEIEAQEKQARSWPEVLNKIDEQRESQPANDIRKMIQDYPCVKDMMFAFRDHGLFDFRFIMVVQSVQLTYALRSEGLQEMFTQGWDRFWQGHEC